MLKYKIKPKKLLKNYVYWPETEVTLLLFKNYVAVFKIRGFQKKKKGDAPNLVLMRASLYPTCSTYSVGAI